ncbi:LOW QUALITY PROTEIN: isoquinoline 1-oxidoreductase alpha subunit [Limimaricola cinnabarinus LL-001]|uniref:Isoquinoline 1-oxidoreductase alpha subunit n=1 Tax=Limimaricola cinnabarinus LL-001 TaxID=1337093 RepID=U2YNH0_9RHOB|nr:LOW QUALITY PROTEIN: isoquinoline 1-oxidoreductase alpha subunit [Limimaricola cinnabarinus LL-001]
MVKLMVNGVERAFDGDEDTPLLWYLRDELGLTGTKYGCGIAACGACTVHIDARRPLACITPVGVLEGAQVKTIEGLSEKGDHPVQEAWRDLNVAQCGYCQAGQIMQAAALVDQYDTVTDDDIDAVMSANICRCGTYPRIRAAIKQAAGQQASGAAMDADVRKRSRSDA